MRTVKEPALRKQEILEGAMGVFLQKGYEKTTIADIARALGISQGLCYRYFSSKEEIYEAVVDAYAARIAEENLRNRPEDLTVDQWIRRIPVLLKRMEEAEQGEPRLCEWVHDPRHRGMHQQLYLKVGEKLLPHVTAVLEQGKARGEISIPDCARTAAFGLYGEIGLLLLGGSGEAIQENWRRLLGLSERG